MATTNGPSGPERAAKKRPVTLSSRTFPVPSRLAGPGLALALGLISTGAMAAQLQAFQMPAAPVLTRQMAAYDAVRPKNIVELQPFRSTETARLSDGQEIKLISLNPNVNSWFILQVGKWNWNRVYHIQNPSPGGQTVSLSKGPDPRLVVTIGGKETSCAPWANGDKSLSGARATHDPYAPICQGHLFLRNPVPGHSTELEWTANFIRQNILGGEMIVGLVKDVFYKDAFRIVPQDVKGRSAGATGGANGPDPAQSRHFRVRSRIGLKLVSSTPGVMVLGRWYPVADIPGVFASAMQPAAIDQSILNGPGKTDPLDRIEARSMDYFVAFDLSRFDMGYALGTAHPSLGWSPRPPAASQDPALPGPDGVGNPAPVVPNGMLNPVLAPRVTATFAAGFKRRHGAFMAGPFSKINHGSHYGFIQQGVIMSKLNPGLSTIYVMDDGSIHMGTWTKADNALLPKIRFARQNGVPLLRRNPAGGAGIPGALVTSADGGNWSGSADNRLRTLRAGACMLDRNGSRYFVYAFFSTATPSAMARTFEGYGCSYAMLLDMNALEHTYFALYDRATGKRRIEHLIPGMAVVDMKNSQGQRMARFVDYPDNRDFFYMIPRQGG